jgi:hypothetical protein
VGVTVTFPLLYVFVLIHHASRRLLHFNVTAHPTAAWTLQQLREAIGYDDSYRYLIHDRDSIFARNLDESIAKLGFAVPKSPPRAPTVNAICERVIGTITREYLDWLIPLSESHLRCIPRSSCTHYDHARRHTSLRPGLPDPPTPVVQHQKSRHRSDERLRAHAESVLGDLHHAYSLVPVAGPTVHPPDINP